MLDQPNSGIDRALRVSRGFTLLETLVALTILSFSLGALFSLFSDSLNRAARATQESQSVVVARSLLARLGRDIPLQEGEAAGSDAAGFTWHINQHREQQGQGKIGPELPQLLSVRVTVQSDQMMSPLQLETLRLLPSVPVQ